MDLSAKIEIVNVSDTGRKRPHNEDSAVTDPSIGLAIVASTVFVGVALPLWQPGPGLSVKVILGSVGLDAG